MAAKIDQKAYLQKYLSGPSKDKKKKKKKAVKGTGLKIIDDDVDLSKLRPLDGDELDFYGEGEDAPQIAGIIDERPEELQKMEQFKTTTKWRVINQDDGFNSKLEVEEIKKDVKEMEKDNEITFGKMYSDSEDEEKKDSDASPPRKQIQEPKVQNNHESRAKTKAKKPQNNSDSDFSPPRKPSIENKTQTKSTANSKKATNNSVSDCSPPRRKKTHRQSPSRSIDRRKHSPNQSPPRKAKKQERVRKPSRWGDSEDLNSGNPEKHKELSSIRKSNREYQRNPSSDSDVSPPRKSQKSSNTHLSPPRKNRTESRKRLKSDDSDLSPPRKSKRDPKGTKSSKHRNTSDSDLSPPRKTRPSEDNNRGASSKSRKSPEKDSDESPPRRRIRNDTSNNERYEAINDRKGLKKDIDSPPPSNKKMAKTLEGKLAGLQDSRQLRKENDDFRQREELAFKRMTDDVSGRNAKAVSRRKKRETSEDRQKQTEKAQRQKEIDEKYKKWSKGIKQQEDVEARAQEFLHEAAKPLARLRGDADLEARLRDVARPGDPMLSYINERKREQGEMGPEKPSYKGSFPPNRFNIRPGYRWDGVDRSNGYEKKFFDQQSKRKAQEEEAYKWSTEDL